MYSFIRPLLFALEPEKAHALSIQSLSLFGRFPGRITPVPGQEVELMGLRFANRLGLAAGLDKDAEAVLGLAKLGFGFVEVGTVTPKAQAGNPRPRLFRLPEHQALINRMGFNNCGVDAMVRKLATVRESGRLIDTRLGVNLGKNKDTPNDSAEQDYLTCLDAVAPYADYLTINLSSPNTPGLRLLQTGRVLERLLARLKSRQQDWQVRLRRRLPLLLKIAPDLNEAELDLIARTVLDLQIDGVIATNTTIDRAAIAGHPLAAQAGGLSGVPLAPLALQTLGAMAQRLEGGACLVGVGGISTIEDARAMRDAGADLIQVYTGFIYRGPIMIQELGNC